MAIDVFDKTFQQLDALIMNGLIAKASNVIQLVSPLFAICFGIYMILITFSYMREGMSPDVMMNDFFRKLFAAAVVISIGLNMGYYTGTIIPMIQAIPVDLTNAMTNGVGTTANAIDALATTYADAIIEMWESAHGIEGTIIALFNCVILVVCTAPFFVIAAAFILLAKLFTLILLVVGPLFIGLGLFPPTRQYAWLWVGQVVNFMLLQVFFNLTASIMIQVLNLQGFDPITAGFTEVLSVALIALLFTVIGIKLPELASALSGGMAAGGFSTLASAVSSTARMGKSLGGNSSKGGNSSGSSNSGGAIKNENSGK